MLLWSSKILWQVLCFDIFYVICYKSKWRIVITFNDIYCVIKGKIISKMTDFLIYKLE